MRTAAGLAMLVLTGCAATSDWPRWRGPDGAAVADGAPLPAEWSPTRNIAWCVAVPGEGSSSPVVSGDAVFVTSALEGGKRRVLHCLDRRTGATRWTLETPDPDPERASAITGHAAATPVTDGRVVVAVFGNAGAVAADLSGRRLWTRALGEFDSEFGLASSPILHEGLVYVVCDHDGDRSKSFDSYLAALDARTGAIVWKTERPGLFRSWSTPIVVGNELIVSGQDAVRAYDPKSGRLLWSAGGMSGWVTPSPVAGKGLIFAVSGKDGPTAAIRPGGAVAWREERGGPYVCSPVLYGDLLYVADESGRLICREAVTGKEIYRARLHGTFKSSPVAGDGKIYFTNEAGLTSVVKAGPEFRLLAENRLDEEVLASPAISAGALILRTRTRLWSIRK